MCMGYLPACMFIYYMCDAPRGHNSVLDFLEMELQTVERCHGVLDFKP